MSHRPPSVLVFGSEGLLGRHVVNEYLLHGEPVIGLAHHELDVTDDRAVKAALDKSQPDVVINCAALCHFQRCENEPLLSAAVNRDAPIRLAEILSQREVRLVHFSTDYIFDGKSDGPYKEGDTPQPLSVYGLHKAAVEKALAPYFQRHLLLRVAWLFGDRGRTFLSMLPDLLMSGSRVQVASGKRGSCLHVGYAARVVRQLVAQRTSGLLNLVHAGETSWEGFAHECLRQLRERGFHPSCSHIIEVPLEKMAVLAGSRPLYSVLDTTRLTRKLGEAPLEWQYGLSQFLDIVYPASPPVLV